MTILSAPPAISCLADPGLIMGARVVGDWSRALNVYSTERSVALLHDAESTQEARTDVPVWILMDGPYGGCSIDIGESEKVLLVSGGSGATFALAMLDDILGRCVTRNRPGGERTRRIDFAWCTRSFGVPTVGRILLKIDKLCIQVPWSGLLLCSRISHEKLMPLLLIFE